MALPLKLVQRIYDMFYQTGAGKAGVTVDLTGLINTNSGLISLASAGFAQKVPATALADRKNITFFNSSASTIWIGGSSLASGTGIGLDAGEILSLDSFDNVFLCPIYAGQIINYLELS